MSVGYEADFIRNVAHSEAARRNVDSTACYLHRGRSYRRLPNEDLYRVWTTVMHAWASALYERPAILDDLESEFALRGCAPPYALARDDIGRLAAFMMARVARMPEKERRTEGGRIVGRHREEVARRN